jgi:hypothetical protein
VVIENGQTRDTDSIETRHIMDKPETHAVLRQDTEWTNQRHRQRWEQDTEWTNQTPAVLRQDTECTNQ